MIASRKGLKATFAILMGFMLAMLVDAGAHALPGDSPGTGASVSAKTAGAADFLHGDRFPGRRNRLRPA